MVIVEQHSLYFWVCGSKATSIVYGYLGVQQPLLLGLFWEQNNLHVYGYLGAEQPTLL